MHLWSRKNINLFNLFILLQIKYYVVILILCKHLRNCKNISKLKKQKQPELEDGNSKISKWNEISVQYKHKHVL